MFDAFPYDEWSETVTDFWTFGGANSTGTYILTALGVILMVASLDRLGLDGEHEAPAPGGDASRVAAPSIKPAPPTPPAP